MQALLLLLLQYDATLSRGGGNGRVYFCKVDYSRISWNFSRNWFGLSDLCEILQVLIQRKYDHFQSKQKIAAL